ncbi:ATP synthase subunit C [Ruminococcaceae bacterium OttesenSCG-928-A16]|nr:ATP synthase subunit C [Ruminococcaceae bacterium OttesenSCG-928-A16]
MEENRMKNYKRFGRVFVFVAVLFTVFFATGATVFAAEAGGAAAEAAASINPGLAYLGAGLSTGIAAIGGGIAVGGGAPAAIGALTEDPKSFGKSLIFVALGEGIALYGMLIAILILAKV